MSGQEISFEELEQLWRSVDRPVRCVVLIGRDGEVEIATHGHADADEGTCAFPPSRFVEPRADR